MLTRPRHLSAGLLRKVPSGARGPTPRPGPRLLPVAGAGLVPTPTCCPPPNPQPRVNAGAHISRCYSSIAFEKLTAPCPGETMTADENTPPGMGTWLARRLPGSVYTEYAGETHVSLLGGDHLRTMLSDLAADL